MKTISYALTTIFILMGLVGIVQADLIFGPLLADFSGNGTYQGATFVNLWDWLGGPLDNVPYSYDFTLNLNPPGKHITSAQLTLTHVGNISTLLNPEVWLVSTNNSLPIGQLSPSPWGSWKTDSWILSQSVLDLIESTNPWYLGMRINDTKNLPIGDDLFIDKSTLSGTYNPIPEPRTLLLLGSGLVGLAGYAKVRFGRRNKK